MNIITKYFPDLSENQITQFNQLGFLYKDWNSQINVISRKDIDELYLKHILHSLGIAKVIQFKDKTKILDVGTGGGFPGIPLAILFPNVDFVLVDSIGKKIKVVQEIVNKIGLSNVKAYNKRAEEIKEQFDFVVTRAVAQMNKFIPLIKGKMKVDSFNELKNGILFLKGGDLTEEIAESKKTVSIFPLSTYFNEEFFETKVVLYTRVK
ncbi:MAG: 16S rRNA (guanine(527)-N(7))-methyltransferase RsmG [Flavobacteriales bacterium CG_4_10_14_0_2_um_filter_32_8]|nr:MAG: 16S rRNA (guanine(527)-N(7))-methyltransferase RsmG [Flavobacteriales bacterium CG_4_10_14_0_2_um_filter_32_8]PJB14033.1 MAG: 16S rRNA (guanine(527)-N(7))-methyltransferase RsmG [Flavobacteriales bacterium CG_4_9_14_3_um_filter_32_8]